MVALGVLVVVLAVIGAVVVIATRSPAASPTAASGSPGGAAGASSSPAAKSAGGRAEGRAAAGLAALLAKSVTDRGATINAVHDVAVCGQHLTRDAATLRDASASRRRLLAKLVHLHGRSALPGAMLRALTGAWRASGRADHDYSAWAAAEAAGKCRKNDTANPSYRAALIPDGRASRYKKAFAQRWNRIAHRHGLPTYQWDQL